MSLGKATILFAGDFFAGSFAPSLAPDLASLFSGDAIVVVNVEGPITETPTPVSGKAAVLRTPPRNALLLEQMDTRIAVLANNHIFDHGVEGFESTVAYLERRGIVALGAGMDEDAAWRPHVVEAGGLRIGLLAVTSTQIQSRPAGASAGCAVIENDRLTSAIRSLTARVDVVVVSVHWGLTNYHYPLPEHRALAHAIVDAGAKLVVGHHPHVVQGWERVGRAAILYSLGNFCFSIYDRNGVTTRLSRENRRGMLARIDLEADGVARVELLPTVQLDEEGRVALAPPGAAQRRVRLVERLSKPLARSGYDRTFRVYALCRLAVRASAWIDPRQWSQLSWAKVAAFMGAVRRIVRRKPKTPSDGSN